MYETDKGTTLGLTLTNPITILFFAGVFADMQIGVRSGSAILLVMGVFAGSAVWWALLCLLVGAFRQKISVHQFFWTHYLSGCILLGFGFYMLLILL